MADINLPAEVTQASAKAKAMLGDYYAYAGEEATISDVLRDKVRQAYQDNQDIVEPLDVATKTYYEAPSEARVKYQNIFNPFERENLVAQYVQGQAIPMKGLSSVYGQRMGRWEDLIGAGTRAYEAEVLKKQQAYESAANEYQSALNEFSLLNQLQRQADELALSREKFEFQKTQPTSTGGGTLFERQQEDYQSAVNDARAGATLGDMQAKYGSKLGTDEVVRIYAANTIYGAPQEDYARKILGLAVEEPEEEETKEGGFWNNAANFFGIY